MKTKTIVVVILLMITTNVFSQLGLNLGNDLKITILGSNNKFTFHKGLINYQFKVEYIDSRNTYFALGIKYVNLKEYYKAVFVNFGEVYTFDRWKVIPQLELGRIQRERANLTHDFKVLYIQTNFIVRYNIWKFIDIEAQGYIQLARDLPNRTFRYGGNFAIIITLYNFN